MPDISITSSLYKTEKFLPDWRKNLYLFTSEASRLGLKFEINAIANDPSEIELEILEELDSEPWFNLHIVPRESFYASWNRGVQVSNASICTSWNVDDVRNAKAIVDGLKRIKKGASLVYYPFVYKRYLNIFGIELLAKRKVINPPLFDHTRFTKEMHCGPFYLFTKDLFEKTGPYDETFRIAGDYDWCARAANICSFTKSDIVAGTFSKRDGTLSGGKNPKQVEENARIENKLFL